MRGSAHLLLHNPILTKCIRAVKARVRLRLSCREKADDNALTAINRLLSLRYRELGLQRVEQLLEEGLVRAPKVSDRVIVARQPVCGKEEGERVRAC